MDEIFEATGTVELVTQSKRQTPYGEKDAYNLALSDKETYSGFGICEWKEGEQVTFKYKINGQYRNIVSEKKGNFVDFKVFSEEVLSYEEQVALTHRARQSNGRWKIHSNKEIYTFIHGIKKLLEICDVTENWQFGENTGYTKSVRPVKLIDGEWWII